MVFKKIFKERQRDTEAPPPSPGVPLVHQLALRLRGAFDLDEVLQLVANSLGEQMQADHCLIYLCDPNVDTLRWRAGYQQPQLPPLRWPLRESDFPDLFARLRQSEIVRVQDPLRDPLVASCSSRFESASVRTLWFVPAFGEQLEAVIILGQVGSHHQWSESESHLLESVAAAVAVAARHVTVASALRRAGTQVASATAELQAENQQLQGLIQLLLLPPADLSSELNHVSQSLCDLYRLKACSIEEVRGEVTGVLSLCLSGRITNLGVFTIVGTPRQRVLEGEPHVAFNAADAYPEDRFLKENDLNFYAGVPITSRSGAVLGLLNLYNQEPVNLQKRDLKTLSAIARRIGTEMESERRAASWQEAEAEIQWRREAASAWEEQLKFIQEARELLRLSDSLETGLQELVVAANTRMGSDFAAIALYDLSVASGPLSVVKDEDLSVVPGPLSVVKDKDEGQLTTDTYEPRTTDHGPRTSFTGDQGLRTKALITAGIDASVRDAIGELPTGKGLLGVLNSWTGPLRLDNVAHHPRFTGFPANHPVVRSFLAVPLQVRGQTVGAIYFADKHGGEPFSTEDEMFASQLAAQIALAVAAPVREIPKDLSVIPGPLSVVKDEDLSVVPGPLSVVKDKDEGQLTTDTLGTTVDQRTGDHGPRTSFTWNLEFPPEGVETLLEHIGSGVLAVDRDGRITAFNPAMERLTGYRRSEVLGLSLVPGPLSLVPGQENEDEDLSVVPGPLSVVKDKDEGQLTTDTYEQRTKDHGPRTTDQGLRTEDQLQLFARGQPLQDAIVQGRVINLKEVHLLRRGGARRPVGLTAMPLSDASGALSGAVGVLTDITELRALQHERYRLTPLAVIGEMSARLAHEIKNPLSSMMSGLELLKRRTHYGEREGQYFDRLIAELQRLDTTVREMLAYSREPPPVLSPVDPAEPLQCALDTLMPQLEAALISVNRDVQWGLPATLMDANQMEQVFLNLIVNAIQAMPDGGTLTATVSLVPGPSSSVLGPLSLAQDQGSGIRDQGSGIRDQGSGNESLTPDPCSLTPVIEYTISDTGVGVPPEVIDKIFDPFFSTKTHGTGLGLASAQRTVEAHQGQISLESRPGPGATFIIRLPHRRE